MLFLHRGFGWSFLLGFEGKGLGLDGYVRGDKFLERNKSVEQEAESQ